VDSLRPDSSRKTTYSCRDSDAFRPSLRRSVEASGAEKGPKASLACVVSCGIAEIFGGIEARKLGPKDCFERDLTYG
jgi:hypothetical protein